MPPFARSFGLPGPRCWSGRQTSASLLLLLAAACVPDAADVRPPTVTLNSPAHGERVAGSVLLSAEARDDTEIEVVSFRVEGVEIVADHTAPYEASWDTRGRFNGNYRVSAVARDAAGLESESALTVVVENAGGLSPDSIEIINPPDGATACGTVVVEAALRILDGTVQFAVDGELLGSGAVQPYREEWFSEFSSDGPHRLTATVTDAEGRSAQHSIDAAALNNGEPCFPRPTLRFNRPEADTRIKGDVRIMVSSDDDEEIQRVRLEVEGEFLGEDDIHPYGFTWPSDPSPEGIYWLQAIALDDAGRSTATNLAVGIDRSAPAVLITSPVEGENLRGVVTIEADVSDTFGVQYVQFLVNDRDIGWDAEAPYAVDWDTTLGSSGSQRLRVTAWDYATHTGSHELSVTVDNPPTVSITDPEESETVGGLVKIEADSNDDVRPWLVELFVDGVLTEQDDARTLIYYWDTCLETSGAHTIDVVATDDSRQEAAASISVTVAQPLELVLVAPTLPIDASELLVAHVFDDDSVESVVFDLDGTTIATASSSSGSAPSCALDCVCDGWEAVWDVSTVPEGSYTLTATATNVFGESASDSTTVTVALDGDGDGQVNETWGGEDCDDTRASVYLGAPETTANGRDEDCDGVDSCFLDGDGDNHGTAAIVDGSSLDCDAGTGAPVDTDCDDTDAAVSPAEPEVCLDGLDQDCDGFDTNECPLSGTAIRFEGEVAGDDAGTCVAAAGDVNADGYADLLITSPYFTDGALSTAGATYLVLGGPSPAPMSLGSADARYTGMVAGGHAGEAGAGVGDVDGDGYDDLLIGAPEIDAGANRDAGATYLVLGGPSPASDALDAAAAQFDGEDDGDESGAAVAAAGDVNADGYADFLIGSSLQDAGGSYSGAAYLLLGGPAPASMGLGSADVRYAGEAPADRAATAVAGAGDVDGDGYDDVLVGADDNDDGGSSAGAAYLMLGGEGLAPASLSAANAQYTGEVSADFAGRSLSGVGDVDGDGYADVLVGAPHADDGAEYSTGAVYLILGSAAPASMVLDAADAKYTGEASGDSAGSSVAGAGDVNADGHDDLLIGAEEVDSAGATNAGAAYLVLGSSSPASMGLGSSAVQHVGESIYGGAGGSVAGVGDANNDGFDDLLIGAENDYAGGADRVGAAYLILGE